MPKLEEGLILRLAKGRTIRKVMGGGGDFLRGNIYFFCTPIEEIFFFSHLMAGNIFFLLKFIGLSSKEGIFFFALCLGRFFFSNFFLGINLFFGFAPPPPSLF